MVRPAGAAAGCAHPHRLKADGNPCECAGGTVLVGAAALTGVQLPPVSLFALGTGRLAKVCEHCLNESDAAMLRAMGMKPGATVRVCRTGEPCIVEVLAPSGGGPCGCDCSTRIGLAKDLAMRVMVVPVVTGAAVS
jgi:Fe2+ transport system protein FeoA